jgi:hypothetical protein
LEAGQGAKGSTFMVDGARPLRRIMRRVRAGRIDAAPVLFGIVATVAALFALAWLERSVATGFRIYVLARALRTAWAATLTLAAAVIAAGAVTLAAGHHGATASSRTAAALAAFATAIAALGAMLPDWSEFSCVVTGAVIALWAAVLLVASQGNPGLSKE